MAPINEKTGRILVISLSIVLVLIGAFAYLKPFSKETGINEVTNNAFTGNIILDDMIDFNVASTSEVIISEPELGADNKIMFQRKRMSIAFLVGIFAFIGISMVAGKHPY